MRASLIISGVEFYDAPSEIEGSPYWIDLWEKLTAIKLGYK